MPKWTCWLFYPPLQFFLYKVFLASFAILYKNVYVRCPYLAQTPVLVQIVSVTVTRCQDRSGILNMVVGTDSEYIIVINVGA